MPTHKDLAAIDLLPKASAVELAKEPPTLNTNVAMKPGFREMVNEFARKYGVNSTRIIEHLLMFTATSVPFSSVDAYLQAQYAPAPPPKSRVRRKP